MATVTSKGYAYEDNNSVYTIRLDADDQCAGGQLYIGSDLDQSPVGRYVESCDIRALADMLIDMAEYLDSQDEDLDYGGEG